MAAKVKDVTLSFPPSGSPDVVKYMLYVIESSTNVEDIDAGGNYTAPSYDLAMATSIDLSTLPGMTSNDGVYNIGITAIDDAGNESSMSVISDVPLDFIAPDAPGAIVITRS